MSSPLNRRIAFSMVKGMNISVAQELTQRIGCLDRFFEASTHDLWQAVGAQKAWCTDSERAALLARASSEEEFVLKNKVAALFYTDTDYSARLGRCDDAPALLYRLGHCNLNAAHVVAIVGTRRATAYGTGVTQRIVKDLAEQLSDLVIVSGLAYGIDVAAHRAALACDVPTVGVVAHGLRTIYPADHRDIAARMISAGGAIVTEYPSDAQVHRGNFLARNRIVAGLSDIVIIVESDAKGGAMVTASIAQSYNREVGAIPGRITDRYSLGPNRLIHDNRAAIIRDASDIISLMNWTPIPHEGQQAALPLQNFPPEAAQIVDYLRLHPDATVNDMTHDLAQPYHILTSRLMMMEMDNLLTALPGGRFQLNV